MPQDQPLLLFVVNPISGGKKKHDWENAIRQYFADKPYKIELFVLTGKDDKTSIDHYIKTLKPNKIVAVGGDGTVKSLGELLINSPIPLGILPAGSANGMAADLGIPDEMEAALNIVVNGVEKVIDVIEINGKHICLHLSDVGLNAELVKHFERHPKRGKFIYFRFLLKVLWYKKKLHIQLKHDDELISRKAYMVVFANARMYGTGATINPTGATDDGIFEVIILRQLSFIELIKMLFKRKQFNPRKTEIFTATEVSVTIKPAADFQVDGEYIGKTNHLLAKIRPAKLRMIVPRS